MLIKSDLSVINDNNVCNPITKKKSFGRHCVIKVSICSIWMVIIKKACINVFRKIIMQKNNNACMHNKMRREQLFSFQNSRKVEARGYRATLW